MSYLPLAGWRRWWLPGLGAFVLCLAVGAALALAIPRDRVVSTRIELGDAPGGGGEPVAEVGLAAAIMRQSIIPWQLRRSRHSGDLSIRVEMIGMRGILLASRVPPGLETAAKNTQKHAAGALRGRHLKVLRDAGVDAKHTRLSLTRIVSGPVLHREPVGATIAQRLLTAFLAALLAGVCAVEACAAGSRMRASV